MEESTKPAVFVNVYSLGKFAFCPRAGVLAHEQKTKGEDDEETRTPRLNYLPLFDIELIRKALDETKLHQKVTLIVLSIFAVAIWLTYSLGLLVPSVLLSAVALLLIRKGLIHFEEWRELNRRIERHDSAKEARLGNPEAGPRQVNWWALLRREDFASAPPAESLEHSELRFGGEPARVAT